MMRAARRLTHLPLAGLLLAGTLAPAEPVANPFGRKYPPRVYQAARLEGPAPQIDGRFDDPAWQQGEWSGGYRQQIPAEGAEPSQPTEIKILYDDRHVYVAIRAFDDPAQVRRYPGRRDSFGDFAVDIVGVCFDSYNDKRTGFEFDLTAGGGKIDLVLGNGDNEWDTNWDAVWDGKVGHDEKGWMAEFSIPFNQLRFAPEQEQVWGMHAWRWHAANQEESQWQLIPRQNTGRMYQLGELRGIRDLPRTRHLELMPYLLGKTASGPSIRGEGQDAAGTLGLDAKLGLTSNFTLDATVNPDFGQVEADPSVVNLTAYETFYEERRPFFLEGRRIFAFETEDFDQLFYSRRIGQPPSWSPSLGPGEELRAPEATTILSAVKITGKTDGGLSVGVLQSLTQKETAVVGVAPGERRLAVEPFGSYTVGRIHKDWDKGTTSLGGMVTQTHRSIGDPQLGFLPANALTGGVDFARYFANRRWLLEARGLFSRVSGEREAILALQTNPVHYYQRTDAGHLKVDPERRSLSGHGGSVSLGTSGDSRLRVRNQFHWYSPGLDLNDVGYLRQADVQANEAFVSWVESKPRGAFREYSFQLSREDQWDFDGLHTAAQTGLFASGSFRNKWGLEAFLERSAEVDTRALRGGPALRRHDFYHGSLEGRTDPSRRLSGWLDAGHSWSVDDESRAWEWEAGLRWRTSNRLALSGEVEYETLRDDLQYVGTVQAGSEARWLLGRIEQDTWSFTLRANLAVTPDLTVQYYGSPFISTGRYGEFKRATETLAQDYDRRFARFAAQEISLAAEDGRYQVSEAGGPSYAFANPDFSFRQFRSNLVVRWEYQPGSSLYVVWSQGRTDTLPAWQRGFGRNWDALWSARSDNVFLVKFSYWFSP